MTYKIRHWGKITIICLTLFLIIGITLPTNSIAQNTNTNWWDEVFYSHSELSLLLQELQVEYPDIFMYYSLGVTYEGREIWAAKLSDNVTLDEDEPEILISGGAHGNERPGYQTAIYSIISIAENYTSVNVNHTFTNRIRNVVNNSAIFFIPMINPDGIEAGTRKNKRPNDCLLGDTAFCGVDVNRNFPYKREEFDKHPFKYAFGHFIWKDFIKNPIRYLIDNFPDYLERPNVMYPFFDIQSLIPLYRGGHYRGPYAFSENESIALKHFIENRSILISVDYHIYGEKIVYPWWWTDESPPDKDLFSSIGENISNINNYELIQGGDWYYIAGGAKDWLYAEHNVLPFTIELCNIDSPLYYHQKDVVDEICKTHVIVNLYVAERAISLDRNS